MDERRADEGLVTARPPAGFTLVRQWRLDTTPQLAGLRASLKSELAEGTRPEPELDPVAHDMVLVASELATNALRHGIPPTIVRLLRSVGTYLLDVADHDLSSTPHIAGPRAPGEGGYGLQIARRVAVDVGWYTTDATKHVWALFPAREASIS
ncbi:ATP-binding protein [Cellulomonas sp. ATA003]|uniref:ATP-binding protein n=1 Tax=Cellulomonas sp. ATA003 TaxID=3073064 RepID=UPI002873217C|nr:ATP-binding protein [Cellulomonas sp. ATA003]WNB85854.1 ATP-binding protein [Cellulomonas sp. ATA003]